MDYYPGRTSCFSFLILYAIADGQFCLTILPSRWYPDDIPMFCGDFHKFCLNFRFVDWNHWNHRNSICFFHKISHFFSPCDSAPSPSVVSRHQGEAALKRFKYLAKNEDAPWQPLAFCLSKILGDTPVYLSLNRENLWFQFFKPWDFCSNLGVGWCFFQTNSNGWTTWGRFSHPKEEYQWIAWMLSSFKLFAWRFWLKQSWLYVPARDHLLGYP